MDDRFNTIAGWVLGGGIVLLGASLVTGEYFKAERPETMGFPIAGVVEEGAGEEDAEPPIAALLQNADLAAGEAQFRKCSTCHTINPGGATGLGPNLHGIMGANVGHAAGFAYSDALLSKGGTWTWETMSEWLRSPRNYAPGTKMTFAGLSDPQDRANLIAWMNAQGSNLPLPPPPAAGAEEPAAEAAAEASDQVVNGLAPDTPVAAEGNAVTTAGPAAPEGE
ncbi:c-type cytochrome [Sphingosinicella terrae]|uniref:c-type cytochrome n=1 Tax=Sphingosinicella terrae TaxID=2172047 RepID=UPI000E0D2A38|nr:cytochrome c family protein [Sphingosinicella terrae]